jgi:hypothetical protein
MLTILMTALLLASPQDEFCKGFQRGYQIGWCWASAGYCVSQPVPVCPPMYVDPNSTPNESGYSRGFIRGTVERKGLPK